MKIFIKICLLVCISWQVNGQNLNFNSPNNYRGFRPEYKDTLSIDLEKGKKIEFIYRWYDLFGENNLNSEKNFWLPFERNFKLLKTKVNELDLEDDPKYKIMLKTTPKNFTYYHRYFAIYKSNDLKNKSKEERNQIIQKRFDSISKLPIPLKQILSVSERIKPSKHKEYQLENKELVSQTHWQHILEVNNGQWKVRIYINDFEEIETLDIEKIKKLIKVEQTNFIKKRLYRYHSNLKYKIIDNKLKLERYNRFRFKKRTRNISLNVYPQVGTSLIKGKFSADLGVLLGMNFGHRQNSAARLALRYQLKAFGEENIHKKNSVKYNGFLDGIIDINIGENYKTEQWVGAGIGYLIHQEGNVYGDNTARIFLKYRSSKLFGVQPEFNYSFKEKKGFVGLGFYFSL